MSWLKWPLTLAAVAAVLAGAYFVHHAMKAERRAEEADESVQSPRRAKGGAVVLDPEAVEKHGIEDEPAGPVEWSEPVTVYGRLVPNQRATSVVQAPFAGTLQPDPKTPWPSAGTTVKAGEVLGQLNVRVGPQERLDVQLKLKEARAKVEGAEKVVAIQQERLTRLEKASKGGEIVSQRELDDARVMLTEAKANLAAASAGVDLWQNASNAIEGRGDAGISSYSQPITAPADGEVVETAARPGMSIEAGAVIARVVDFRRPLAQVDLPPEVVAAGPPPKLDLSLLPVSPARTSTPSPTVATNLLGPAPQVDMISQFSSFWYEAGAGPGAKADLSLAWRPGRFVTGVIRLPGAPKRPAVAVPYSAVLAHQGRLLVYVREGPGKYERREVRLLGREGDRAVLGSGVRAGEPVVVRNAQVLLSEEFRAEAGDD